MLLIHHILIDAVRNEWVIHYCSRKKIEVVGGVSRTRVLIYQSRCMIELIDVRVMSYLEMSCSYLARGIEPQSLHRI